MNFDVRLNDHVSKDFDIKTLKISGLYGAVDYVHDILSNKFNLSSESDSTWACYELPSGKKDVQFVIGEHDYKLMTELCNDDEFQKVVIGMINVRANIKAPLYWWKDFDMIDEETCECGSKKSLFTHPVQSFDKEFTLDDFSYSHLEELDTLCLHGQYKKNFLEDLESTIDALNDAREMYIETGDRRYIWQIMQLMPISHKEERTVIMNYAILKSIYKSYNKGLYFGLDEWKEVCEWIENLPYNEFITKEKV